MKIATFESKCSCGCRFDSPTLSDMSYGEFLYFDLSGTKQRYFCGLDNPIWDFVSKLVDQEVKATDLVKGTMIQKIIGKIADRHSPDAEFIQERICPDCKSIVTQINTDARTGSVDVEELSFNQFQNQDNFQKRLTVYKLLENA